MTLSHIPADSGHFSMQIVSLYSTPADMSAFIQEISALIDNISISIPPKSPSLDLNDRVEQLHTLHLDHIARRNFEALTDPKTTTKKCEYSPPIVDFPIDQKAIETKALDFILLNADFPLHTYITAKAAKNFLMYPTASKSHEIARKVFNGEDPATLLSSEDKLGDGSFATVYKSHVCSQECACKVLLPEYANEEALRKECELLLTLQRHPNLPEVLLVDPKTSTIYLQLAQKGSLRHLIESDQLSIREFNDIVLQIAKVLVYIHGKGLVHRDIKADNILITDENVVLIADFGTVIKKEDVKAKDPQGTIYYLPPENLSFKSTPENCQKIDVWSFGMLLWQRFKKEGYVTPFIFPHLPHITQGQCPEETFAFIYGINTRKCILKLEESLDPTKCEKHDPDGSIRTIMKRCLTIDQDQRPDMATVLQQLSISEAES